MLEFCPIPEQFPNRRLKYFEDLFFLDLSLTCQLPQDILKEFFVHWTLLCRCRMLLTVCRRVQRSLQPGRLWFTLSNLSTFRPTAPRRIFRTECKWNPVDPWVDPLGGPPGWTPGVDPRGGPPEWTPGVDPRGNRYPEIHTLFQRLAFGSVWHRLACLLSGFRESRYIEAKNRQSRHGKVLFFSKECRRKADW